MTRKPLNKRLLADNPRASLSAWERFRPHIIRAISSYPNRVTISPTTLRACTYESRVRDAIRGAIAFGYEISPHSTELLIDWYSKIVIRSTLTTVVIGPPSALDDESGLTVQDDHIAVIETHTKVSVAERDAFVLLIASGRLGSVTLDSTWPGWQPDHPNVIATIVDEKTILI